MSPFRMSDKATYGVISAWTHVTAFNSFEVKTRDYEIKQGAFVWQYTDTDLEDR